MFSQELHMSRVRLISSNEISIQVTGDQESPNNITQLEWSSEPGQAWSILQSDTASNNGRADFNFEFNQENASGIFRARRLDTAVRTRESLLRRVTDFEIEPRFTYVGQNNLRVVYYEFGDGEPVVFLHGVNVWSYVWRDYFEPLSNLGRRVIALDLPGWGFSDMPSHPDAYSKDAYVEWLTEALFEDLDLNNVVLIGHTFSGDMAIRLAMDHPTRVNGIGLIGGSLHDGSVPEMNAYFSRNGDFFGMNPNFPIADIVNFFLRNGPLTSQEVVGYNTPYPDGLQFRRGHQAAAVMEQMDPEGIVAQNQRLAWEKLQESTIPLLVISSDDGAQGAWGPKLRSTPGAQGQPHRHFDGDVRHPEIDHADEVRDLIVDFVESID